MTSRYFTVLWWPYNVTKRLGTMSFVFHWHLLSTPSLYIGNRRSLCLCFERRCPRGWCSPSRYCTTSYQCVHNVFKGKSRKYHSIWWTWENGSLRKASGTTISELPTNREEQANQIPIIFHSWKSIHSPLCSVKWSGSSKSYPLGQPFSTQFRHPYCRSDSKGMIFGACKR